MSNYLQRLACIHPRPSRAARLTCLRCDQASNLCTYIARGDVALSVMMTTVTTIGAIFMTPLLCKLMLGTLVPVDAVGVAISTIQVDALARRSLSKGRRSGLGTQPPLNLTHLPYLALMRSL